MKAKISALMDGELEEPELGQSLRALRDGGEALETWRRYHLISDAMRDTQVLSSGFSARFAERLALEPTVLAPASAPQPERKNHAWVAYSAAAGLAAVALVGSLTFQFFGPGDQQAATAPRPQLATTVSATVPMPGAVNDYLFAHQNYSSRGTLQGVAPYVRTVSDPARPR
ncbi:MAG: sigma-E factor negative regulatory protein [Betaproteobacteria bacterium]